MRAASSVPITPSPARPTDSPPACRMSRYCPATARTRISSRGTIARASASLGKPERAIMASDATRARSPASTATETPYSSASSLWPVRAPGGPVGEIAEDRPDSLAAAGQDVLDHVHEGGRGGGERNDPFPLSCKEGGDRRVDRPAQGAGVEVVGHARRA